MHPASEVLITSGSLWLLEESDNIAGSSSASDPSNTAQQEGKGMGL